RSRGMEPMVTLFHFSSPLWLAAQGGWRDPGVIAHFRRFVRYTVEQLGDLVSLWCTINEPNIYAALGYLLGEHAPGEHSLFLYFRVLRHLLQAHAAAYRTIRALDGGAQVGLVKSVVMFEALNEQDRSSYCLAGLMDSLFNEVTLRAVHDGRLGPPLRCIPGTYGALMDSTDFVGVNYYSRQRVSLRSSNGGRMALLSLTPGAETSDEGRNGPYGEVYPAGLYQALRRVARLGKPIYVTENGLPDDDDDQRPRFLLSHLAHMQRAIADGIDVRGYYHWTFTDNFEWAEGWGLRFGLVALDPETQQRTPRPSAQLYSDIIRENAISPEMVSKYAPELATDLFEQAR
ncbi:MAG: glycoside hydrolase family 1 protein, partial [Anaerolineae bacterium]